MRTAARRLSKDSPIPDVSWLDYRRHTREAYDGRLRRAVVHSGEHQRRVGVQAVHHLQRRESLMAKKNGAVRTNPRTRHETAGCTRVQRGEGGSRVHVRQHPLAAAARQADGAPRGVRVLAAAGHGRAQRPARHHQDQRRVLPHQPAPGEGHLPPRAPHAQLQQRRGARERRAQAAHPAAPARAQAAHLAALHGEYAIANAV